MVKASSELELEAAQSLQTAARRARARLCLQARPPASPSVEGEAEREASPRVEGEAQRVRPHPLSPPVQREPSPSGASEGETSPTAEGELPAPRPASPSVDGSSQLQALASPAGWAVEARSSQLTSNTSQLSANWPPWQTSLLGDGSESAQRRAAAPAVTQANKAYCPAPVGVGGSHLERLQLGADPPVEDSSPRVVGSFDCDSPRLRLPKIATPRGPAAGSPGMKSGLPTRWAPRRFEVLRSAALNSSPMPLSCSPEALNRWATPRLAFRVRP